MGENTNRRYEALDSWRGIAAILVVFGHFNHTIISHFDRTPLITHAFIFVDFFFVLSGFVMSASYAKKISNGMPISDYALLRFFRLYPLHILTLLGFVAFEFTKFFISTKTAPFGTEGTSVQTLIANVFLVQSLGFFKENSWNFPSWSISVEFYTYLLFAFSIVFFKKNLGKVLAFISVVILISFLVSDYEDIDVTADGGLFRCIMGFSIGVLTHSFYSSKLMECRLSKVKSTFIEIFVSIFVAIFIWYLATTKISFFAPLLFALVVIVFAMEGGFVSSILKKPAFLILGMLSYSIYMTHALIQLGIVNITKLVDIYLGTSFVIEKSLDNEIRYVLNTTLLQGDACQILGILIVILVSWITYNFIEVPCNRWGRAYVKRRTSS